MGTYQNFYHGCTLNRKSDEKGTYISLFRWHPSDPIRFKKLNKVTVQQIGWHEGLFERSDVPSREQDAIGADTEGFNSQEKYLLARINGRWDIAAVVVAMPIGELETLRALKKLIHVEVVGLA